MSAALAKGRGREASPDAALLTIERRLTRMLAEMDAVGPDAPVWEDLNARAAELEDLARDWPAESPAGIAAKLRIVWRNVLALANNDETVPAVAMVKAAIEDAERLTGGRP